MDRLGFAFITIDLGCHVAGRAMPLVWTMVNDGLDCMNLIRVKDCCSFGCRLLRYWVIASLSFGNCWEWNCWSSVVKSSIGVHSFGRRWFISCISSAIA